jgi:hypothetical protein
MHSEISTGVVGLIGAFIGGGFTLAAQWAGDLRAQKRAASAERRRYVAALRLTVMDLERSQWRLARMSKDDPRGFIELPRGAWLEYRALLAPELEGKELAAVVDAYNEVVEWNTILWAAFGESSPESFHNSDQHDLNEQTAVGLLNGMRSRLEDRITHAATGASSGLRSSSRQMLSSGI